MARELAFYVAVGIVALSVPIIIISLRVHLPSFALPFERLWLMIYAIASMILVHTIPEITAMAIVATYSRFLSDGAISTLFSAGRSPLAIAMPAAVVAGGMMLAVAVLSMAVAPGSAKNIHDTLLFLRRDFNLSMLEPGVFHEFRNEGVSIFFGRKIDATQIQDVFIAKRQPAGHPSGNREETYVARRAVVVGMEGERGLLLLEGQAIVVKAADNAVRRVEYTRAFWSPDSGFATPARGYVFFDEVGTVQLLTQGPTAATQRRATELWLREVVWRMGAPILTLTHTLFGLGLLLTFSPISGRQRTPYLVAIAVCAAILALHILYMTLIELVARIGATGTVLFVAAIVAQAVAGILLLARSQVPLLRGRASAWGDALLRLAEGRSRVFGAKD
ncbi:MAG TPA: LptF/LptG family permease [Beijerinckiaceae bacterium]|nr:LptF/LptG family permease [Beijerinckiaceae bacterium]